MIRLFKPRFSIFLAASCYFDPYFSTFALVAQNSRRIPTILYSLYSGNDLSTDIATHLSNCSHVLELDVVYARIIRNHFLEFNPAPFHWNNIIRSYTRLESPIKAIRIHVEMLRAGTFPDCYTLPIVLKAVCQSFAIEVGQQIHSIGIKLGLQSNEFCESGFLSLYCKAGEFESAHKLFEENPDRKLGSWNAIIGGLSQAGLAKEAINKFVEMMRNGFVPDGVTMVSVTSACGSLGDIVMAFQLHKCILQVKATDRADILLSNSLIDMYGKCGRMDLAFKVFETMEEPNVSSWTSMIVGYAMHGHVKEALGCFQSMREAGVKPNHVTFVGVLSACVHGGTVEEGRYYFDMMKHVYGITPRLQHYGCMVDLLGRAGLFNEARKMVEEMPMKPNTVVWGCLMGACEKHGNVDMAEWVAKHLEELEPWNDGAFVVLSNIYADKGMWKEVEYIRSVMKQRKLAKIPAYSLATKSG
ncbi:pentatricopeptide repeat-containing protein At1g77170, mitochondrial [Prosopis cineraria]|uniref:pentatricopeptide repeat-containing protein At1g77170, mitochondrial n=1 Tax=Prosopis cineraria TaxID=364024 RepID=UPI002410303E|nr:pentatricopeptide repeat-containing protein At1g77170, mitochondrial [Prosopis cineraria]